MRTMMIVDRETTWRETASRVIRRACDGDCDSVDRRIAHLEEMVRWGEVLRALDEGAEFSPYQCPECGSHYHVVDRTWVGDYHAVVEVDDYCVGCGKTWIY